MKITAALAWWCEPVEFLDRMVASLDGVVDSLVAIDGAWEGVPYDLPYSTPEEHDALANACAAAGIDHRIIERDRVWGSQVEKRCKLMEIGGEGSDWVLVIDGDEMVGHCDPVALRQSLELTDRHMALATIRPLNDTWPLNRMPAIDYRMGRLYRAGTTVEIAHNGYRYGGEWLLGDPAYVLLAEPLDLSPLLRIDHDNVNRGDERVDASRAYVEHRQRHRTEQWTR